jgi:hypothetical protein
MNHKGLICDVHSITYDFDKTIGFVDIGHGCRDMGGTIELFEKIDPKVKSVYTFSPGVGQDTTYLLTKHGWEAFEAPQLT